MFTNRKSQRARHSAGQGGFVSIFSVLIIMTILTLLVIGFSTATRQAQKRALDNQLGTEAFYAAETGLNKAIYTWHAGGLGTRSTCDFTGAITGYDVVDVDRPELAVTCILSDGTPPNLRFDDIGMDGLTVPVERAGSVAVVDLKLSWDSTIPTDPFGSNSLNALNNPIWETGASWGTKVSAVRVDLTPGPYNDIPSRNHNAQSTQTFYLYPSGVGSAGAVTISSGPLEQGQTVVGKCNVVPSSDNYRCEATVTPTPGFLYAYAHIVPLYNPVRLQLSAVDGSGSVVHFKNAQAIIDVTGRANDVYKRIQVRVPGRDIEGQHIPYSLMSADTFCKRFIAIPGASTIDTSGGATGAECQVGSGGGVGGGGGGGVPPAVVTDPCTNRGPNLLSNSDFAGIMGQPAIMDPAIVGFSTLLPNRGPDIFPDDVGINGSNADYAGWSGGVSLQTGPKNLNFDRVYIPAFPGDTTVSPAVSATNFSLYSNPNQTVDQPKGTDRTATYIGYLWRRTITGLLPNTTYDFSGYFANVLTDLYYTEEPTAINPRIEFSVDGTIIRPTQEMYGDDQQWHHVALRFTTGPGQTSAIFNINDYAGARAGDDFAMAQLGVYQCL